MNEIGLKTCRGQNSCCDIAVRISLAKSISSNNKGSENEMRKRASSLISTAALLLVLWLIWTRLHIVFLVVIPWWGFLLIAILLFLVIDHFLHRALGR
jgi:hypothetical protein